METITPHAFNARVAEMTRWSVRETQEDAAMNGAILTWSAHFTEETDPTGGQDSSYEVCPYTTCTLIGAWAEHDDGSSRCPLYAGNREEMVAALGEVTIKAWESYAEEIANG